MQNQNFLRFVYRRPLAGKPNRFQISSGSDVKGPKSPCRTLRQPSIGCFILFLICEKVLLTNLCLKKILFQLKIYDSLRSHSQNKQCDRVLPVSSSTLVLAYTSSTLRSAVTFAHRFCLLRDLSFAH